MENNLNISLSRFRTHSLDDEDTCSRTSRNSYSQYQSAFNSDSECNTPAISVRDMVKRYNSVLKQGQQQNNEKTKPKTANKHQSQLPLPSPQSSYAILNKYSSRSNHGLIVEEGETKSCCKNCANCTCCQKQSSTNKLMTGGGASEAIQASNHSNVTTTIPDERSSLVTHVAEKSRLKLSNNDDVVNYESVESSYQSKTTISKTASGVRIIIDIYFDQEQCVNATDVIGSRVETDIPHSRILNEFQQQTLAAAPNKQQLQQ